MSSIINEAKYKKICETLIKDVGINNKLFLGKEIGKGDYSKVYEINYKDYIFVSKIQIYKQNESTKKIIKIIEKEINLIDQLLHINIIRTLNVIKNVFSHNVNEKEKYPVYTFIMEKNSVFMNKFYYDFLFQLRNNNSKIKFFTNINHIFLYNIIQQILNGIYHLKKINYKIADLRPENISLTNNLTVKLKYFSLNRKIEENNFLKFYNDDLYNIEPKNYDKYLEKFEIYSLGAFIYFLICNNKIIYDYIYKNYFYSDIDKKIEILKKILKNNEYYDKKLINFVEKCLSTKNLSINECLQQKFIYEKDKKYKEIIYNNYNEETKIFIEFQKHDFLKNRKRYNKFIIKKNLNI